MILTNKRTTYNVNHSNLTAKLSGTVALDENNRIEYLNGTFTKLLEDGGTESLLGNFDYSEQENQETFNKSIYNVPFSEEENLVSLLNDTITKIKTEVSTDIITE